jgi:hypothetical protein
VIKPRNLQNLGFRQSIYCQKAGAYKDATMLTTLFDGRSTSYASLFSRPFSSTRHKLSENMSIKHLCDNAGPCPVPPHPDILASIIAERKQLQHELGSSTASSSDSSSVPLSAPTGTVLGLNDGTIFPKSHYDTAPSESEMSRAALERAPLRGVIRYVMHQS